MEETTHDIRAADTLEAWQQALAEVPPTPALSGALQRRDDLFGRFVAWYGRLRSRPRAERRRWQRQLGLSLAGIALLLAVNGAPAGAVGPAATITVDGVTCTLVDAITAANTDAATGGCAAGSGADIIDLQTNVTLTAVNNTTDGNNGLPVITSVITIEGNGNTISRQAMSPDFRIMFVGSGGNLTLNSATVSGGVASGTSSAGRGGVASGTSSAGRGGAIYVSGALLTVTNSTLSGNSSTNYGGAIDARYDSTVTVSNSTLSGNVAANGGGIHTKWSRGTVTDSFLSGNSAVSGGGIMAWSSTITVSNSTLSGNSATWGGGIHQFSASLAISNSTLSGNRAIGSSGTGGGVDALDASTVTVLNSTLTGNSAHRGGGIRARTASLAISNSTLSGNSGGIGGGGIWVTYSPTVMVSNSTLSGNSATIGDSSGGGIYNRGSTVTVSNSTLSGNSADFGGGIWSVLGSVTVLSSIVALQGGGDDCFGVTTGGYNIESGTSCGFTGTGDLQNQNAAALALGALANNGGPTQTQALGLTSVAVDRIPVDVLEANGCGTTVTTDQRGFLRANGATSGGPRCDVGAFEVQVPLAVTLASFDAQAMIDRIQLSWETVSEANNAGFNLYRSASPAGPEASLAFVPSHAPGSTQGASYSYEDTEVSAGQTWYYWLEDVDLNGAPSLHGPVSATFQAPTAVTLDALQAEAANPGSATTWGALAAALIAAAGVLGVRRRSRAE